MNLRLLLFATTLLAPTQAAMAADNLWSGTWRLNDAKSQRTGNVDTVRRGSDGKYTVATSGLTFSFRCDGADYPMPGGHSVQCREAGPNELDFVAKAGTDELARVKRTLSDGGKIMTVEVTGTAPSGTAFRNVQLYKRLSTGSGWEGQWQNTKVQTSTREQAVVEHNGDSITFTYPMEKSSLTAKLDGTPATVQGPHPEPGLTVSMKATDPLTLLETDTVDGVVVEHDTWTVSADGRTLTIQEQRTDDPSRQVLVFEKQ